MIHKIAHLLGLNKVKYRCWPARIINGEKLMCGNQCIKCGQVKDVKPAGIEFEFLK